MTRLERTLRTGDGLAVVVGIMVGSGIFRTPGTVASQLGRPGLTFVAWALGGGVGFLGALLFAELSTRHPQAGGKYVYAREAFGRRAAFVIGWIEALGIYCVAIAAIAVVCGEYLARLCGWPGTRAQPLGTALVLALTGMNLFGVSVGRWAQNVATGAKVLALLAAIGIAVAAGTGEGWTGSLPNAPAGLAAWGALAIAFQSVIWTYYGYPDAAKIAEEVKDPDRALPRILLVGIASVTALYLMVNAAFLQVLPFERIASSNLVAGDVAAAIFGSRAGALMAALALLVVLGSLNGNLFVTPRVVFGLARDGLGPGALAQVNEGGSPWAAMILVGAFSAVLAATGTFERLLSLAIVFVLVTDGFMVLVLFRLRSREPRAPFRVPLYPAAPLAFLGIYALLFIAAVLQQPGLSAVAVAALAATYVSFRLFSSTA
ncbi:MAG TPA: amino acid permease [Myxococcales bacterium]|nr:amino acid permease [Myxococcales bacterium]